MPEATLEVFADDGALARTVDADPAATGPPRRLPPLGSTWTTQPRARGPGVAWFAKSFDGSTRRSRPVGRGGVAERVRSRMPLGPVAGVIGSGPDGVAGIRRPGRADRRRVCARCSLSPSAASFTRRYRFCFELDVRLGGAVWSRSTRQGRRFGSRCPCAGPPVIGTFARAPDPVCGAVPGPVVGREACRQPRR